MRGKVLSHCLPWYCSGITPAYAGKRVPEQFPVDHGEDHPRLCGEKFSNFHSLEFAPGSPPPMRGKATDESFQEDVARDHPRLCGEKCTASATSRIKSGSPPPMRGKVFFFDP